MKADNPFDKKLELPSVQRTTAIANSAPFVVDTLELAWAGVRAVFEKRATPEHALMLLPILLERADAERLRLRAEAQSQMAGGTTTSAATSRARPRSGR